MINNLKERQAYRRGVEAAADFLESGGWDSWVAGTPYRLSDVIRFKFNLIRRKDLRRLHGPRRRFATLPGIERTLMR